MFEAEDLETAERIIKIAKQKGIQIVTAESCTGGLLGAIFTAIAGSSDVYERGFITYSNLAKHEAIGVPWDLIKDFGAVSHQVANAMASGALKHSSAYLSLSITGIAGPSGGSDEKPVGLVYFGVGKKGTLTRSYEFKFGDQGRGSVRLAALRTALMLIEKNL